MNILQPTFIVNYTGKQIDDAINFFNTSVAEVYDSTKDYVVDDFVIYDGFLYQCIEDCTGTWDSSKWQIQKLFDNNGLFIFNGGDAGINIIELNQFTVNTTLTSLIFQYIE